MKSGFAQIKKLWSVSRGKLTSWLEIDFSNVAEYILSMRAMIPSCSDCVRLGAYTGDPSTGVELGGDL